MTYRIKQITDENKICTFYDNTIYNDYIESIYDTHRCYCIKYDVKNSIEKLLELTSEKVIISAKRIWSYAVDGKYVLTSIFDKTDKLLLFDNFGKIVKEISIDGRVGNIRSNNGSHGYSCFAFEIVKGKTTKTGIILQGDKTEFAILNNAANCYEPCVCVQNNKIYVVYSLYEEGYYIYLNEYSFDLKLIKQIKISEAWGSSFSPSVCGSSGGGVYITYNSNVIPDYVMYPAFLSDKYLKKRNIFTNANRIFLLKYRDGKLYRIQKEEYSLNGEIENTNNCQNPNVFEINGRPYIIARRYERIDGFFKFPQIVIFDYKGQMQVIENYCFGDRTIEICKEENAISFSYLRNNRKTGYDLKGDFFDREGNLQKVFARVEIPDSSGKIEYLEHYVLSCTNIDLSNEREDFTINGKKLVYGQTHCHTSFSVCARFCDGSIEKNIRFIKDVLKCDFITITDHYFNLWNSDLYVNQKFADFYTFENEFIAIPGYEWSYPYLTDDESVAYGHCCVQWFDERPVKLIGIDENVKDINTFYEKIKEYKVVLIPHHAADSKIGFNLKNLKDNMPVIEVFQDSGQHLDMSLHGQAPGIIDYNKPRGYVSSVLDKGKTLGFIAGGDHMGICLAGLYVKELTKEDLYNAYFNKDTIAVSGITPNFGITDCEILDKNLKFRVRYSGESRLNNMEIVKNGEKIQTLELNGFELNTLCLLNVKNGDYVYIRLNCIDGNKIYSSPIYINKRIKETKNEEEN